MSRISDKDDLFDTYITETTDYLAAVDPVSGDNNWDRLGLTAAENTTWSDFRDTWVIRYGTYKSNRQVGISDSTVTANKNETKAEFTDWVTDPAFNKLNRIGASPNVTTDDRAMFHIKKRKDERTTPTSPIAEDVYLGLEALGGGNMRARCRTDTDDTRASVPSEAKAVELCYCIGTVAPESVAECSIYETSTKALFNFNVGAANAGKKIYCFARWIDTSNPGRAGSWTDMVVHGIL